MNSSEVVKRNQQKKTKQASRNFGLTSSFVITLRFTALLAAVLVADRNSSAALLNIICCCASLGLEAQPLAASTSLTVASASCLAAACSLL